MFFFKNNKTLRMFYFWSLFLSFSFWMFSVTSILPSILLLFFYVGLVLFIFKVCYTDLCLKDILIPLIFFIFILYFCFFCDRTYCSGDDLVITTIVKGTFSVICIVGSIVGGLCFASLGCLAIRDRATLFDCFHSKGRVSQNKELKGTEKLSDMDSTSSVDSESVTSVEGELPSSHSEAVRIAEELSRVPDPTGKESKWDKYCRVLREYYPDEALWEEVDLNIKTEGPLRLFDFLFPLLDSAFVRLGTHGFYDSYYWHFLLGYISIPLLSGFAMKAILQTLYIYPFLSPFLFIYKSNILNYLKKNKKSN